MASPGRKALNLSPGRLAPEWRPASESKNNDVAPPWPTALLERPFGPASIAAGVEDKTHALAGGVAAGNIGGFDGGLVGRQCLGCLEGLGYATDAEAAGVRGLRSKPRGQPFCWRWPPAMGFSAWVAVDEQPQTSRALTSRRSRMGKWTWRSSAAISAKRYAGLGAELCPGARAKAWELFA